MTEWNEINDHVDSTNHAEWTEINDHAPITEWTEIDDDVLSLASIPIEEPKPKSRRNKHSRPPRLRPTVTLTFLMSAGMAFLITMGVFLLL